MLHKIRAVRQDDADRQRHGFQDDFFDLFAWTDVAGKVIAFQLCYNRLNHERVLAWSEESGFSHRRIDDGEELPGPKMTPVMVADGTFAGLRIAAEFDNRSTNRDLRWRQFIRGKIGEASARKLS